MKKPSQKVILASILILIATKAEGLTEFRVSSPAADAYRPSVGNNIVVWEDYRYGIADIYGYDVSKSQEFIVSDKDCYKESPAVSGNVVVWRDSRNGGNNVYGCNITSGAEIAICTDNTAGYPDIDGDTVIWDVGTTNIGVYHLQWLPLR